MKRIMLLIWLFSMSHAIFAQRIARGPLHSADNMRNEWLLPGDTLYYIGQAPRIYNGEPRLLNTELAQPEPNVDTYVGGMHEGLNLALDFTAFATLGKHAPHRGGFGQNINAAYLAPLTRDGKLWGAAGIYFNNTTWGGDAYRDVGLYGILGYKINEKWELYAYGQLSIANNYNSFFNRYGMPGYGYWDYSALPFSMRTGYGFATPGANVIGIGAKYNFSPSFSIQVDVQQAWYNNSRPFYGDHHLYPNQRP